jgi:hypothetical protein
MLHALQDADQLVQFLIDILNVLRQNLLALNRLLACLNVIEPDGLDDFVVSPGFRSFRRPRRPQKSVRRPFKFGVVAARGAHDRDAVSLKAVSIV